jgi:hypothetical protein
MHKQISNRNDSRDQTMDACPKEEGNKIFHIPSADTSANPRAVMVMNFYTHSASSAMEGSRRPD